MKIIVEYENEKKELSIDEIKKIIIDYEDGLDEAKRALFSNTAFGLLWDIETILRNQVRYKNPEEAMDTIDEVRSMIFESGLLEMYQ